MAEQGLQQSALRAVAAGASPLYPPHRHYPDAVHLYGIALRQVVNLGIQFEERPGCAGTNAHALFDEVAELGYRGYFFRLGETEGRRQIGIGVGIDSNNRVARFGEYV